MESLGLAVLEVSPGGRDQVYLQQLQQGVKWTRLQCCRIARGICTQDKSDDWRGLSSRQHKPRQTSLGAWRTDSNALKFVKKQCNEGLYYLYKMWDYHYEHIFHNRK